MQKSNSFKMMLTGFIIGMLFIVKTSAYIIDGSVVTLTAADRLNDNTALIQGFLDNSTYTKIIIQPGTGTWRVQPLWFIHDNTEIHLDANTVLEARSGYYLNNLDCVLKAVSLNNIKVTGGTGSRIFMHKEEYALLPASEHRHALKFVECTNVTISGLTIEDTGGDGIYIGETTGCSNVNISNVTVDGAARNGLAVIGVDGLTVSNCIFINTRGDGNVAANGPWAGIDLEPNGVNNEIKDVLIQNCLLADNGRRGFLIHSPMLRPATTDPVFDITVKNCIMLNNIYYGIQVSIIPSSLSDNSKIVFEDCTISNHCSYGIMVYNKSDGAGTLSFNNCYLYNNNRLLEDAPFIIRNTDGATENGGNIYLNKVFIEQVDRATSYPLKVDGTYFSINDVYGEIYTDEGPALITGSTTNIDIDEFNATHMYTRTSL